MQKKNHIFPLSPSSKVEEQKKNCLKQLFYKTKTESTGN